ncbi:hypothetical protein [Rhizobium sp. P32RR-XVIII]|uniref:c-type cytochrome n=1 Tax=Rhizobium sp. P32RR-XVIII TaxID=2726738 RepID=UPI001FEE92C7|nr:hypothetical protein [Rhizobium sp. P32RR-XVIII]
MPAWPSAARDDEVWALTAFLSQLPSRQQNYLELAGVDRVSAGRGDKGIGNADAFTLCARWHEGRGMGTNGDRIPQFAGLPEEYLLRSLREYSQRVRASGVMEPVADLLDEQMRQLASYYSGLPPDGNRVAAESDPARLRHGAAIASRGAPENDIPACMSCHSEAQSPRFAPLAGQHADHIAEQLRLWQRGGAPGQPMVVSWLQ